MTQQSRIRTLDLIRGFAVMGILAINVASFAQPGAAAYSPRLAGPGSPADDWAFMLRLVVFEGKMRALFAMLFGASLLLYLERKEAGGTDGVVLQMRRLFWLALFGLLHFALLWDGDILFLYACVGLGALILRRAPPAALGIVALATFTIWQAWGVASWMPSVEREARVLSGSASASDVQEHAAIIHDYREEAKADAVATLSPFGAEVRTRLDTRWDYPLAMLAYNWGEILSYMLIGMALLRSGFLAGAWPPQLVRKLAWGLGGGGLALTMLFAAWAQQSAFPELAMHMALGYALAFPHLLMALGYMALLVLFAPRLLASRIGERIEAAGKVAFTNYIGSTVLMCGIFSGWGLGLFGQFGAAQQSWFILLGWAAMLAWSKPWLARFRQGPLEWAWRSLTEWRGRTRLGSPQA